MFELLGMILSRNFIVGFFVGAVLMLIFKPMIDSGLGKLFKKNA